MEKFLTDLGPTYPIRNRILIGYYPALEGQYERSGQGPPLPSINAAGAVGKSNETRGSTSFDRLIGLAIDTPQ